MSELIKILDKQIIRIQVVKRVFTISVSEDDTKTEFNITGISILPHFIEFKPNNIRKSIINKAQVEGGISKIEEYTRSGIYIVNIQDYTSYEIQYLSGCITDRWLNEIWTLLTKKENQPFSITLRDEKMKEIILEENGNLFKNESEFESFCSKYNLSSKDFIESANFSELDIKLKEIESRLDLEQFYARRFLFSSMLIDKLKKRISEYLLNDNQIDTERLKIINFWIERMNQKLDILKNFKNYYKLYDMPQPDNKIEIKDSNNIIIGNDLSNSKFIQKKSRGSKSESRFSRRIGIWTIIIMVAGLILTLIFNWDKIF